MVFKLNRLLAQMRRRKEVGLGLLLVVVLISITGNAATFYLLEGDSQGVGIGDALWYSIVSITTIGYGDLAPDSMGARIGTAIFIVLLGLSAFTAAIGMTVDWLIDLQLKERTGLGRALARDHLLIVNYPSERRVQQVIDEFLGDPRHKNDEIVVITDKVDSLPFDLRNGHFVRGSPLEEETYSRANVGDARQAIVLSPGYDDPSSDSVNASIVSIHEHLNPEIRTVVESLNVKHELLFKGSKNASVVHTFQISSNLLVQESQGPGREPAHPCHYEQPDGRKSGEYAGEGGSRRPDVVHGRGQGASQHRREPRRRPPRRGGARPVPGHRDDRG